MYYEETNIRRMIKSLIVRINSNEVIGILSCFFIKQNLGIKIKTQLFNMNEIIYIVLLILKITLI